MNKKHSYLFAASVLLSLPSFVCLANEDTPYKIFNVYKKDAIRDGIILFRAAALGTIDKENGVIFPGSRIMDVSMVNKNFYFNANSSYDFCKSIARNNHVSLTFSLITPHLMRSIVVYGKAKKIKATRSKKIIVNHYQVIPYHFKFVSLTPIGKSHSMKNKYNQNNFKTKLIDYHKNGSAWLQVRNTVYP